MKLLCNQRGVNSKDELKRYSGGAVYWRVMALAAPWQGVPASQTEVKRFGGPLYTSLKCHANQVNTSVCNCIQPMQKLQLLHTSLH